jgi:cysteine desulfurase
MLENKNIYLDHAATTAIRKEVVDEMTIVLSENYGNPSSTHTFGRMAKNSLELARKNIAKQLNCNAQEIIFTSGGTEGINLVLQAAVRDLKINRIISTKTEHHAVLHTLEALEKRNDVIVDFIPVEKDGSINFADLTQLLSEEKGKTLVCLMHVNNEIGTILNLEKTASICQQYKALFFSDTVQSIGKLPIDLQLNPIDFLVASAHKFYGPKGVGFVYIRKKNILGSLLYGGEQEKKLRPGTEPLPQIVGMSMALSMAYENIVSEKKTIATLKKYLLQELETNFLGFRINGSLDGIDNILNVLLPIDDSKTALILFHLDMKGIAVSRGSACQSGSIKPSHVLKEMLSEADLKKPSLRISLSHLNTKNDIDCFIQALKTI